MTGAEAPDSLVLVSFTREFVVHIAPMLHRLLDPAKRALGPKLLSKARRAVGPKVLGALDYYRLPETRQSWGGPLNGQEERQQVVKRLIRQLGIAAIVETGTFRGTSTEFFADLCSGPVFTIEADERLYGYSRARLWRRRNVVSLLGDSRAGLRKLIRDPRLRGKRILFYLDAHWGADLPLAEEIELVLANWDEAVVIIDDFEVPDDAGYGFDDYGEGRALTVDYAVEAQDRFGASIFFPAAASSEETGARRGCVVLVASPDLIEATRCVDGLRPYDLVVT